jgi:hypothetical protein
MSTKELLERYSGAPAALEARLRGLGREQLDFRPFPEAWPVREQVVHLADAELSASARVCAHNGEYPLKADRPERKDCHAQRELEEVLRHTASERLLPSGQMLCEKCYPAAGWVLVHEGPEQGWRRQSFKVC